MGGPTSIALWSSAYQAPVSNKVFVHDRFRAAVRWLGLDDKLCSRGFGVPSLHVCADQVKYTLKWRDHLSNDVMMCVDANATAGSEVTSVTMMAKHCLTVFVTHGSVRNSSGASARSTCFIPGSAWISKNGTRYPNSGSARESSFIARVATTAPGGGTWPSLCTRVNKSVEVPKGTLHGLTRRFPI